MNLYPTKRWYENPLSVKIMKEKYLHDGETSHEDLIKRVTGILSESIQEPIAKLMKTGTFFPGGRALYGAGSKGIFNASCSNCYTIGSPADSLDGIFDINRKIANIFKAGGGVGINISSLRPNGARTNNAARTSTGAVSFMHIYDTTGAIIGYHGRRSAILIGMNINHPDIEEFVNLRETSAMKSMNISCLVNDKFMAAVQADEDYELSYFVEATGENFHKTINARKLFNRICEMNWNYGDPGMIFIDTVRQYNLQQFNEKFHIDICNPCGEYFGPAWNSCNLGSLNLYNFVKNKFNPEKATFDFDSFRQAVDYVTCALDEILTYGYDLQPLDENRDNIDKWRSIGLGFFGLADMFIAMGVRYGSPESVKLASKITKTMLVSSINASARLASYYNAFGECDPEKIIKSDIIQAIKKDENLDLESIRKFGMRNSQLMSIAPTGSLSMLAGSCSSGIEPIFKVSYERTTHGLEDRGITFNYSDRAIADLLIANGVTESMSSEEIKKQFPWVVEAADIDPMDRINVQAAIQEYSDNAISSTVNLPEEATIDDIKEIYMEAFNAGLKGITVFRNNCKRMNILGTKKKKEEAGKPAQISMDSLLPIVARNTIEKPIEGSTYLKHTACVKSMYVTVNHDENGNIFEVFTNKSVNGCTANIATITRMTSMALRMGAKVTKIIEELKENNCQACLAVIKDHPERKLSRSCPYAIAEALEAEYKKLHPDAEIKEDTNGMMECPQCHSKTLVAEGRCYSCKKCGWSRCD